MYITKYSCVFLKLGDSIYVVMDLIPVILGSLPLAHNASLVMRARRRQTFEKRGRPGLKYRPGVDAMRMQGAMWVESTAIKNAITRVPSTFRVYAMGIL